MKARQCWNAARLVASAMTLLVFVSAAYAQNEAVQTRQEISPPISKEAEWSLRLPENDKVVYKGVVSFDNAGHGSGAMMYPAPGVAGLVAAIITHGLIVQGMKSGQLNAIEEKANEVLLPYQAVLSNYTHQELMQEGLKNVSAPGNKRLLAFAEKPGGERRVESIPVFSLTQDQSAIILENVISIYDPATPSTASYQNIVKVISQTREGTDRANFWTANDGEKLKEESARLFAYSLDIALNEVTNELKREIHPQKTFRYFEGGAEKMERGELISEYCNRVVIKNLRGWLMSMPVRQNTATAPTSHQCDALLSSAK